VPKVLRMKNKEFSKELEQRTRKFAVRIIRLSTTLPHAPYDECSELLAIFASIGKNL
jgi:hypothetical protein